MKRLQIESRHKAILADYGLPDISAASCQHLIFEPGEVIAQTGMQISSLYLVVSGRAKAFRLSDHGKSLIIYHYISTGLIGDLELLAGTRTAVTTVTAISEFSCIAIPYDQCLVELQRNLPFSNMLGHCLAEKLAGSADNYAASALYTGEQRLCSYILQNANGPVFCETLTEVASSVGMSYRHMFRILNDLCRRAILQKTDRGFLILNRQELIRLSSKG